MRPIFLCSPWDAPGEEQVAQAAHVGGLFPVPRQVVTLADVLRRVVRSTLQPLEASPEVRGCVSDAVRLMFDGAVFPGEHITDFQATILVGTRPIPTWVWIPWEDALTPASSIRSLPGGGFLLRGWSLDTNSGGAPTPFSVNSS